MKKKVIEINDLKKSFGSTKAVDGLTLEVNKGEIFGFLGPNGAGKTTTIRSILNFVFPTSGTIKVFGKDPKIDIKAITKEVGYIAGEIALFDNYKVKTYLNILEEIRGEKGSLKNELLLRFQLDESKKIKNLSKGNKQKVAIVQAFMHQPKLLILDEPTSGLDPLLQQEFYKLLDEFKSRGATIFFSSHLLDEVQRVCDRVAVIKNGKLIKVESIKDLKRKNIYQVELSYEGKKPTSKDFAKDSIEIISDIDDTIIFNFKGDINSLLENINNFNLTNLRITEPSLEDMFLAYYNINEKNSDTDKS